jgi:urate oxidase
VSVERGAQRIESGLDGLLILKSTGSSFGGFPRDAWTTLPEAADRVFSTLVSCTWQYPAQTKQPLGTSSGSARARRWSRPSRVTTRAARCSTRSTPWARPSGALPEIESLRLSLPNKHCLLFDLGRFGLTNANEVFVPTDEPYGLIEATLRRG